MAPSRAYLVLSLGEPLLKLSSGRGRGPRKPYMYFFFFVCVVRRALCEWKSHEQKSSKPVGQKKKPINPSPCAVHVCANWCWLWSLKLGLALWIALLMQQEWARPLSVWPLNFSHALSIGLAVLFSHLMRWNTRHSLARGEADSVWKVVDCVEVDLLHPRRKWVVWLCIIVCLLVYYWHCLWTSGGRSKFLGEMGLNRIVLLCVCSGPAHWVY